MIRLPPRSTRTDTPCPSTTPFDLAGGGLYGNHLVERDAGDAEEVLLLGGQRVIRPHLVTHRLDEGRDTGTQRRAAQRRDRASPRAEALIGFVTSQDVDRLVAVEQRKNGSASGRERVWQYV